MEKCKRSGNEDITFSKATGGWGTVTHIGFNGVIYKIRQRN